MAEPKIVRKLVPRSSFWAFVTDQLLTSADCANRFPFAKSNNSSKITKLDQSWVDFPRKKYCGVLVHEQNICDG
jgi:hypothetical protein